MCLCCTQIQTSETAVMERCGAFDSYKDAGCVCFIWPFYSIGEKLSLKVQKLEVELKTKTIDDVFISVSTVVNIQVKKDRLYQAFYSMKYREHQLCQFVKDGMRSAVCTMTLDGAYAGKQELSDYLMKHLQEKFNEFGYSIMSVLIVEINPDAKVMQAMNEINSSRRMKVAALQRAEGEKIIKVKQAEAEAESMHLSGVGVARQRRAIMDGLKESIVNFNQGVSNTSNKDVMDLLILNQYFDTLDAIGAQPGIKTIFLPKAQGGVMTDMMAASAADSVIKVDSR